MARYDHLPLFKAAYDLSLDAYKITRNFSREYKYTIGERIKNATHEIMDLIMEANSAQNRDKAECLDRVLNKTEKLKIYLRLSCDLKALSPAILGRMAERMEIVGKQANSWKNWARSAAAPPDVVS
jgi:hypothetical protein